MDISSTVGIASVATSLSSNKLATEVDVAVLKKAIDLQAESAVKLIESIPQVAPVLPSGNDGGIDVMA